MPLGPWNLYPRVNCLKTIPFTAAHTYIPHIWQYPSPPLGVNPIETLYKYYILVKRLTRTCAPTLEYFSVPLVPYVIFISSSDGKLNLVSLFETPEPPKSSKSSFLTVKFKKRELNSTGSSPEMRYPKTALASVSRAPKHFKVRFLA